MNLVNMTDRERSYRLDYLSEYLGAELVGDEKQLIWGIGESKDAAAGRLIFVNSANLLKEIPQDCEASAILTSRELFDVLNEQEGGKKFANALLISDVYVAYAKLSYLFRVQLQRADGVDKSAFVDETAQLGAGVSIGPHCTIAAGAVLGDGVTLMAGVYVGENCVIGKDSLLYPHVTLYHGVKLGERVVIHSGAVLGSDGFGNANQRGKWYKIYHLGGVTVGDDVEIGANTTIDRGALHDTVIGRNVKLDNLIQIAHNVEIGEGSAMAACVGVAGSTKIGRYCMIGGGVGIAGHVKIGDQVLITGGSMVGSSLPKAGVYASSIPAIPQREWWKTVACLFKLTTALKEFRSFKERWTIKYWRSRLTNWCRAKCAKSANKQAKV